MVWLALHWAQSRVVVVVVVERKVGGLMTVGRQVVGSAVMAAVGTTSKWPEGVTEKTDVQEWQEYRGPFTVLVGSWVRAGRCWQKGHRFRQNIGNFMDPRLRWIDNHKKTFKKHSLDGRPKMDLPRPSPHPHLPPPSKTRQQSVA